MTKLSFDINVALRGGCAEVQAQRDASEQMRRQTSGGRTTNRHQAVGLLSKARADVIEMETERKKRGA